MRRAIVWFRRDLSLDDNLAWADATHEYDEVAALYVLDPRLLDRAGTFRRAQLHASVRALAAELARAGGALTLRRGAPVMEVPKLAASLRADAVCWNADVTRYATGRDAAVERELASADVAVVTAWSTVVHPPGVITTAAGTVPKVFTRFHQVWQELDVAPAAVTGHARVVSGESEALPPVDDDRAGAAVSPTAALAQFIARADEYGERRDDLTADVTSHLSAHLRFGTISPRAVVRAIGRSTPGRRAFVRQLAWRDWYAHLFDERNDLVERSMHTGFDAIAWRNDPDDVEAWRTGHTGVPIVDAAMRQLARTGWMPNRARMIAASFLVKDLLVDWRIGERHFRHVLVDGDVPQNAGNWQWVAGTGPDAAPYFRVLNPITQARRFDPAGEYVRRWVPELGSLPGAAVHAPWELGPLELAAAGVELGRTYPFPVVDHADARRRALAAYNAARTAGAR